MQYRPDAIELLSTIQEFLIKEILPELNTKENLAYKTLVSWNMLGIVARELETFSIPEKIQKSESESQELAKRIRELQISSPQNPEWFMAKERLKENLKVANPRFALEE